MSSTRLTRRIDAPPSAVYRTLLDADAVRRWMVPEGMRSEIHAFEPVEGGAIRISLTYDEPTSSGKTSAHTDTYGGRFERLVPDREVVQVLEFETDDPGMQGPMTITYTLAEDAGGTRLTGVHEDLPPGVSPADNELGWRMSIDKLAALVEQRSG